MSPELKRLGIAFIVSGPSGTGKTTMCRRLQAADGNLRFSVSCTTREPRRGEVDGQDYHFISSEVFRRRVENDEFIEHAIVHDNYYGTVKSEIEAHLQAGRDVLLDIDVQGAMQIRKAAVDSLWRRCTRFIFVGPPSFGELERRLRDRGTDSEEVIAKRLLNARIELKQWREYDYLVVNSDLDEAIASLVAVVRIERLAIARMLDANPWG